MKVIICHRMILVDPFSAIKLKTVKTLPQSVFCIVVYGAEYEFRGSRTRFIGLACISATEPSKVSRFFSHFNG